MSDASANLVIGTISSRSPTHFASAVPKFEALLEAAQHPPLSVLRGREPLLDDLDVAARAPHKSSPLPVQLTDLIGRDDELARVRELIARAGTRIEHLFDVPPLPKRTSLFEQIRSMVKTEGKREDAVRLIASLLSIFLDDGQIRSPNGARRKKIVLDDVEFSLAKPPGANLRRLGYCKVPWRFCGSVKFGFASILKTTIQ